MPRFVHPLSRRISHFVLCCATPLLLRVSTCFPLTQNLFPLARNTRNLRLRAVEQSSDFSLRSTRLQQTNYLHFICKCQFVSSAAPMAHTLDLMTGDCPPSRTCVSNSTCRSRYTLAPILRFKALNNECNELHWAESVIIFHLLVCNTLTDITHN